MRVLISFLYLIVYFLDHGNTVYSELPSPIHCSSKQHLEQQSSAEFFNSAEVIDSDDDGLEDVDDENTTEVNESSNGKVLSKKSSLQNSWALNYSKQFIAFHRFTTPIFISPFPLGGSSSPIYLTNRALRI